MKDMIIVNSLSKLQSIDWDYLGDQSESPFSNLHFHPGRFISQIPATLIGRLTNPGDTVLDPYCGSGTSLVEAQRLGRRAIGLDMNPVSVLISRGKLIPVRHARIRTVLRAHLSRFLDQRFASNGIVLSEAVEVPPTVQLEKWYHPDTAAELREIWSYLSRMRGVARQIFEFCFSSILMPACSETRHWGYICDNTRPLGHHYVDAINVFTSNLRKVDEAYLDRDVGLSLHSAFPLPVAKVFQGDCALLMESMESATVDLVITSPPYFGVIDYVKSQRLTMEWWGYRVDELRATETGARSKRHRLAAYAQYVADIEQAFHQIARVLKPHGVLALLIGQSQRRKNPLPELLDAAHRSGLRLQYEFGREIARSRRQAPSLMSESLYIFSRG